MADTFSFPVFDSEDLRITCWQAGKRDDDGTPVVMASCRCGHRFYIEFNGSDASITISSKGTLVLRHLTWNGPMNPDVDVPKEAI